MEKPFTGLTASISVGGRTLAYVSGVDLSLEKDIIEILAFGAQFKEKVPSIKDWSASIDGTVALAAGGTQKDLYDAFDSGDPIDVDIFLDDTTKFSGEGFVSSFDISAAPDDKISLTSEIAGSGAVTLTLGDSINASKSYVTVSGTGTQTVTITGLGGTGTAVSSNTAVATASLGTPSGGTATLTITGVTAGRCSIFVNDYTGASATHTSVEINVAVV